MNHESEYHQHAYGNESHMTQSVFQGDLNSVKELRAQDRGQRFTGTHRAYSSGNLDEHVASKGCL